MDEDLDEIEVLKKRVDELTKLVNGLVVMVNMVIGKMK